MLAVLEFFTIDKPEWTVEEAAARLGVSTATAYRYFKRLTKVGLLSPLAGAHYSLGPAIIQMDRQIQICDPMLRAARPVMIDLIQYAPEGSTMLLSRPFHDCVMCVHQVLGHGPQQPVSYERGRLMPLFRGATSTIILAHLSPRHLKSLFKRHSAEIANAGLGKTWDQFRSTLAGFRRAGGCITRGDIDSGRVGIAAPILDSNGAILGSLSFVLLQAKADEAITGRLFSLTCAGAREIERAMADETVVRPARMKMALRAV
ncbi:MAG: helix-turn-helix domain-containing protein [Alphaproteobacteria bacterium]|nr:helix-turn-helix domain-containing protein [Alphaproteobacteria bacterium]